MILDKKVIKAKKLVQLVFDILLFEQLHSDSLLEGINVSWYEANETCTIHNSTLLSFSSYNDVLTVQALLIGAFGNFIKSHIHIGLQRYAKVSDLVIYAKNIHMCNFRFWLIMEIISNSITVHIKLKQYLKLSVDYHLVIHMQSEIWY